ncbi:MAG: hypothetical protein IJ640_06240 [Prevotella sp.]|nr:hypothetical protein [Prevotella sp.]
MSKEEYLKAKKALEEEFGAKKKKLAREFAYSNNPVKIGDIIKDHYKIIRVEELSWNYDFCTRNPCMYYHGTRLNKKGKPMRRDADDNSMSQMIIREINGNPYKYEIE